MCQRCHRTFENDEKLKEHSATWSLDQSSQELIDLREEKIDFEEIHSEEEEEEGEKGNIIGDGEEVDEVEEEDGGVQTKSSLRLFLNTKNFALCS